MSEGAAFCWGNGGWTQFAHEMREPHLAFTRGGLLVAADDGQGSVYRTCREGVVRQGTFTSPGKELLALSAAAHLDEFASFTTDGTVTVYKVPQKN